MIIGTTAAGDVELIPSPTLPEAQSLWAYWQSKCPPGGLPRRDDIKAKDIPALLPNLIIAEPIDGGNDWVYRLVGTAIVERSGFDGTGSSVREIFPPGVANAYIADFQKGVNKRQPWCVQGYFAIPGAEHVHFESVGLPIMGRDGSTVWLLFGVFYLN